MQKILVLFVTILLSITCAFSQEFSCPQVDCTGQCGAFTDQNGDGFCDHGQLSAKVKEAQRRLKEKQDSIDKAAAAKQDTKTIKKNDVAVKEDNSVGKVEDATSSEDTSSSVVEEKLDDTAEILPMPDELPVKIAPKYHLISITIPLLVLYILSLVLVKKNVITKNLNRKIWNIALTASFLVSGILGMVLVFWLNYGYHPDCYFTVKVLHVEFGIAMAAISIFHILWHLSYYKGIFKK